MRRWLLRRLGLAVAIAAWAGMAVAMLVVTAHHENGVPVVDIDTVFRAAPLAPPACDWHATFAAEVRALDGDLDAWRIAPVPRWGKVDYSEQVARIDPVTPCTLLPDLIAHEWMHLLQARVYGDVHGHYDSHDDAERVADCGAALLGSRVTPYIDPVWNHGYIGPCRLGDVMEAVRLIVVGSVGGKFVDQFVSVR